MKIAVYAIALNEAKFAERWLASCAGADVVVVADTGSTDGTQAIFGGRSTPINICPFRFDDARNAALALVPDEVDACIALDIDETLEPGWREALETAVAGRSAPWSAFVSFDFNGSIFAQNNRVHSRHGWRWKHPCHEALVPSMQRQTASIQCPDLKITHRPDTTKPRPNYLELLAWGQFEDPDSLRMLHYYGRELMFTGHYADAIERFERYMAFEPGRPFPEEREIVEKYLHQCRRVV